MSYAPGASRAVPNSASQRDPRAGACLHKGKISFGGATGHTAPPSFKAISPLTVFAGMLKVHGDYWELQWAAQVAQVLPGFFFLKEMDGRLMGLHFSQ